MEFTQAQAQAMLQALKEIASFYNPAAPTDGGQAAARRAKEALDTILSPESSAEGPTSAPGG